MTKKQKINTLITDVIKKRFGENWMNLDTERTEIEKENYKKMIDAIRESPTSYEKQISLNRSALHRLWSFVESSGNMTNSLYKDKMNDNIKSGKYSLCKDILAVFKTFIYLGDSFIDKKNESDGDYKIIENLGIMCSDRNNKIKELENTIEYYKLFYKNKHNGEFPSLPEKAQCHICCGEFTLFDKNVKQLACCNNTLCLECLQRCILDKNKCPYCRQNLMEHILKNMPI